MEISQALEELDDALVKMIMAMQDRVEDDSYKMDHRKAVLKKKGELDELRLELEELFG